MNQLKDGLTVRARKLLWIDTIFCDAERDPAVIERYLRRFMLTLSSLGKQVIPEGTDFRLTIYLSRDKQALLPRITEAISRMGPAIRSGSRVHLYDHPAAGYAVEPTAHIDKIKNPNKQPGRRETLFSEAASPGQWTEYEALIRISMDDDDLYFPGHLNQICTLADTLLHEHPDSVSAAGLYRQNLATETSQGVTLTTVDFSRVIPGNKFFVIPARHFEEAAVHSPWSIPELIDEDAVDRFARRGTILTLARTNEPTFVYMRRTSNLSRQSKAEFIDATHAELVFASEADLVHHVCAAPVREPTNPILAALPREFRLNVSRSGNGRITVSTNLKAMFGPDHQMALYLMQGTDRIDIRWYSDNPDAVFDDAPTGCTVRAFVRHGGEIISRKAVRVFD
ncbi:hypothetical protein [Arthrobacter sp. zg-Y179]|uniref:hypothetical protein n=1 Tax=Arthrobacter sp. zg-Y179 TaxID=2894188 RepID=UPI001E3DB611|nr:hypothetical protein [Arthrobacter sp. zg-Y179]MCC9174282.1 hypothetical protein [Arthrobacter sp. zg-Y179]